jgi:hypothetical protein
MNRSRYRMRSTPGFERPAMVIPTFIYLHVVFSSPNLLPNSSEKYHSGTSYAAAVAGFS